MKPCNNENELKQSIISIALSNLSSHIFEYYTFPDEVLIEDQNFIDIFNNPRRFDLFAKYIYILYKERKIKSEWGNTVYKEHIKAFNNFFEDDDSGKTGSEMYVDAFNKLIMPYEKDVNFKPFYLVPLDENNCPLDASHRLALSAYYKHSISFIKMKRFKSHNSYVFDYKFFVNKGLEPKYSDFIALEYSKYNSNTYLLCVFPKAETSPLFDSIICKYADIYYQKNIYLTEIGQLNLILSLYKDEDWLGDFDNKFAGAKYKVDMCFDSSPKALKIYLVVAKSLGKINQLKLELRNLFDLGKHSLHINDFHEQTVRLARTFFNSRSIDYINNVPPKQRNKFSSYLTSFSKWMEKNSLNTDDFCVSGSAVLSAFGIRDCYDLDFLTADRKTDQYLNDKSEISCHNEHFLKYMDESIDNIIFNPENHFYIDNIKFLSLDFLKIFKFTRGESKDDKDVELINIFLNTFLYQHKLKYPSNFYLNNIEKNKWTVKGTDFLDNIQSLRLNVRKEWYKNVTEASRYIHPKIPVNVPEYLIDRYSFKIYYFSIMNEPMDKISIPDYDIFATYNNWYNWINRNFSGLPSANLKAPSLNSRIPESSFRSTLFWKWNEFIKSFNIEFGQNYGKDPANIYWFEYFQNSCLFPKRPAMWGPTYFYKLSLSQQKNLIDNYGVEGIMDFFIFMQQAHEESHIYQKGEPMLNEFLHSWLWCKFIKEADLEIFQINNETSFSCNIEKEWTTQINFTKSDIKKFFNDTYLGSISYFTNSIAYTNICHTAFMFDSKKIDYAKYLDTITAILINKNSSQWHDNFQEKIIKNLQEK